MKTEIKSSDNRLRAVKSGIPLASVIKKKDNKFYVPDLESYFKGADRILRKKQMTERIVNHQNDDDLK